MIAKEDHLIKELEKNNQPVLVISENSIDSLISRVGSSFGITKENNIEFSAEEGVEQLRIKINGLYLRPLSEGKKLFSIFKAELLNIEQINTLLKLLEEPPSYAIIILFSSNLSSVIPTIRSRCKTYVLNSEYKSKYDRESSLLEMLELPFVQFIDKVNSLAKDELRDSIVEDLEELKKRRLNKDSLYLFKSLVNILNKIQNTNVNYKLLAENLYIKGKAQKQL